jgi:2',3'-cyclic-nucleotide 2'-phosphodiesterase (5'-nucleotidase family)
VYPDPRNSARFVELESGVRLLAFAVILCGSPLWSQTGLQPLTVLHTNDLHAHLQPDDRGLGGFAYVAGVVRDQREKCEACIYLNAGDLVQGTPVSTIYRGVPVYEIANRMGIDVSTLGNHEFDYGWKQILNFIKVAKFPIVSANVENDAGALLTGKGYAIKKVGNLRVAVIGVLLGDLKGNFSTAEQIGPWNVVLPVDGVKRTVPLLKDKADVIIVLGHLHDDETDRILREVPEVALVVTGHDHKGYKELKRYDGRFAVEAKSYGVEVGRVDLKIDPQTHKAASAEWTRFPVDSKKVAPVKEVAELVEKWEAKVSKEVDVPIGEARHRMERSEVRKLVEQAMAAAVGADIGWVNSGNIREILPQGKLLARNAWNVLPFDNKIVVGKFKGSELPAAITKDRLIDPNRVYTVAIPDFSAANQSSKDQLSSTGLKFPKIGPLQRDALIEWIKKKKIIGE